MKCSTSIDILGERKLLDRTTSGRKQKRCVCVCVCVCLCVCVCVCVRACAYVNV